MGRWEASARASLARFIGTGARDASRNSLSGLHLPHCSARIRFVRVLSALFWFGTLLAVGGCLSETLIDNYDPSKYASGGTASGPPGVAGTSITGYVGYVPPFGAPAPAFVSVTGGASNLSSAPMAGAGGAGPAAHVLRRYLAYSADSNGGYGIQFGLTSSQHLVAVVTAQGLAGLGADGSVYYPPALLEISANGDVIRQVVFNSASMPDGFAVAADGDLVLAGRLDRPVSFGGPLIQPVSYGYYIAKLDHNWASTMTRGYETQMPSRVRAITQDNGGPTYIGLSEGNEAAVVGLEPNGDPRFRTSIYAKSGENVSIEALSIDTHGQLYGVGGFDGTSMIGDRTLATKGQLDGWVALIESSSGRTVNAKSFGGSALDRASAVLTMPNGHLRIAGQITGRVDLFGKELDLSARGAPVVCDLDAAGQLTWITLLGNAGDCATMIQRDGRTYVAGHLYGPSDSAPLLDSKLYVAEIDADGGVDSFFSIDSSGDSPTRLAVDAANNIWLSGRANVVTYLGSTVQDAIVLMQLAPRGTVTAP